MDKREKWASIEISLLKRNFHKKCFDLQLILPNRSAKAIQRKSFSLGLRRGIRKWVSQEDEILHNSYGKVSVLVLANQLNRSILGVYARAEKLGLRIGTKIYFRPRKRDYISQEDEILKEYWGKIQARQIKQKFPLIFEKRTLNSIRHRAKRLGLKSCFVSNYKDLNGNYKNGEGRFPYPLEWREPLKEQIRQRDKVCMICKKSRQECKKIYGRDLCVHHIDRNKDNLDPANLICLCLFHHAKICNFQDDLQDYFRAKLLNSPFVIHNPKIYK
jgi:hypothetical protein